MKRKVMVFISRTAQDENELLVFDHRDHPEAGTQVPAGTIEEDEAAEDAVIREVFEESGLRLLEPGRLLGKFDYSYNEGKSQEIRHVFHVSIAIPVRDRWEHTVGGDGEDKGMVFQYYWVPLSSAHGRLHQYQRDYLPLI